MSDEVTAGGSRPPVEVELTWEKTGLVLLLLLFRRTWSAGATAERNKGRRDSQQPIRRLENNSGPTTALTVDLLCAHWWCVVGPPPGR